MSMKLSLLAASLVLMTVPALAQPQVLGNGDGTVVEGTAHIENGAFGPYVVLERPDSATPVAAYVAFGDRAQFPDFDQLEGRRVQVHGVVSMYGMPLIQMTSADQLRVIG
jgi:hypothetical protein